MSEGQLTRGVIAARPKESTNEVNKAFRYIYINLRVKDDTAMSPENIFVNKPDKVLSYMSRTVTNNRLTFLSLLFRSVFFFFAFNEELNKSDVIVLSLVNGVFTPCLADYNKTQLYEHPLNLDTSSHYFGQFALSR